MWRQIGIADTLEIERFCQLTAHCNWTPPDVRSRIKLDGDHFYLYWTADTQIAIRFLLENRRPWHFLRNFGVSQNPDMQSVTERVAEKAREYVTGQGTDAFYAYLLKEHTPEEAELIRIGGQLPNITRTLVAEEDGTQLYRFRFTDIGP